MEPIRVLQVVTIMNRGGLETMLMNYYRKIDRSKVQFDFMVHRSERLAEILDLLVKYKLEPKRIRFCHTKKDAPAKILLIEAVKGAGKSLVIESPLILSD